MAKIKLVATVLGLEEPNPDVPGINFNNAVAALGPIKLIGDDVQLAFMTITSGFVWSIVSTPDGFFETRAYPWQFENGERQLTFTEDVEGMPYRTQAIEILLGPDVPFNIGDYTHLNFSIPSVNTYSYLPKFITDAALWLYVDGVLIADAGSAVLTGVRQQEQWGQPYDVRDMRINLSSAPEIFWTQMKRCDEEA